MSGESTGTLRHFTVMIAVIALWWLLPGAVRRVARESFHEFQAPLFLAESRMKDLRDYWELSSRSNDGLIEAGRDLARINADMAVRLAGTEALREENKRLAEAIGMPSSPKLRQVMARVAQRDINRWWSRLVLAKGYKQGVAEGCAVINGGGVVGRVVQAHANTCEVELVSDPMFRISANLDGGASANPDADNRPVIFHGATNEPFVLPKGSVTHIPSDFKNETGSPPRIVSSGLGGVFPPGLYIGTLENEPEETADGLFREARVLIRPDLFDIQEATILVPVGPANARGTP